MLESKLPNQMSKRRRRGVPGMEMHIAATFSPSRYPLVYPRLVHIGRHLTRVTGAGEYLEVHSFGIAAAVRGQLLQRVVA